jgi:acylphosphatase
MPAEAPPVALVSQPAGPAPDQTEGPADDVLRLTAWLSGRVQGVGMRWWVRSRALELGLAGHAANLDDGRVEVVAEGPRLDCEELLRRLAEEPSSLGRPGHLRTVTHRFDRARGQAPGFVER